MFSSCSPCGWRKIQNVQNHVDALQKSIKNIIYSYLYVCVGGEGGGEFVGTDWRTNRGRTTTTDGRGRTDRGRTRTDGRGRTDRERTTTTGRTTGRTDGQRTTTTTTGHDGTRRDGQTEDIHLYMIIKFQIEHWDHVSNVTINRSSTLRFRDPQ